jgi:AcrR family transcriptional regulator
MLADGRPANPTPAGRHRLSGAERRAAIVSKAIELFSQHGFRGTTTRELAAAVGVTEPVLYQHFVTKRELYTAIVDQLMEESCDYFNRASTLLPSGCSDREFFQWLGEQILAWQADLHHRVRLLLFSALEGHELAELWHERATRSMLRALETTIRRFIDEGRFRSVDPALATEAFVGMVAHYGQILCLYRDRCPKAELSREQIVSQFVDLFLNGIRVR